MRWTGRLVGTGEMRNVHTVVGTAVAQHLMEKGLLVSTYEEDQKGDGKVALCWIPRR